MIAIWIIEPWFWEKEREGRIQHLPSNRDTFFSEETLKAPFKQSVDINIASDKSMLIEADNMKLLEMHADKTLHILWESHSPKLIMKNLLFIEVGFILQNTWSLFFQTRLVMKNKENVRIDLRLGETGRVGTIWKQTELDARVQLAHLLFTQ